MLLLLLENNEKKKRNMFVQENILTLSSYANKIKRGLICSCFSFFNINNKNEY